LGSTVIAVAAKPMAIAIVTAHRLIHMGDLPRLG
jgi:hypothetical protein